MEYRGHVMCNVHWVCYNSVIFLLLSTSNGLCKKSTSKEISQREGGLTRERKKKKLVVRETREVALEVFAAANAPGASLVLMFGAAGIMSATPRLDEYSLLCGLIGNQWLQPRVRP